MTTFAASQLPLRQPTDLRTVMGLNFSRQQLDAIMAPLTPGVIVAGAGTGKTTVMAARVVWLVGTGQVSASEVLGLTFTNKATHELGHRVRAYLSDAGLGAPLVQLSAGSPPGEDLDAESPPELVEPTVLTYHAYAARLLTEHGLRIGHEPDTRVVADATRFQLAARAVRRHTEPVQHLGTWVPTVISSVLALDAQLGEHLVTPDELDRFQTAEAPLWRSTRQNKDVLDTLATFEKRRELLAFVRSYREIKAELGLMDFSDQMALAATLAQSCPEVGAVERDRFRIVLLDEYQDTSVAQAQLLTSLFSGGDMSTGRGHPVTAVGDPCQSIYAWRGAAASNIDEFATDFPPNREQAARRYPLSINRRSCKHILSTANVVAADLHAAHPGAEPLKAASGAGLGKVRAAVHETYDDELGFLAAQVPRAHREMPRPRWSEIAVLVRDNQTASDVHDALTAEGVPVEVVGLSGLLSMPEVAEVVATLQIMLDVTANAALLLLLAGPRWAVGPRDLALLGRRARRLAGSDVPPAEDVAGVLERAVAGVDQTDVVSLLEALEDPGHLPYSDEARLRFTALTRELRGLRRHAGEPLLDLVRRVIDVTGLDVELASSPSPVAAARRNNLSTFLDAVASFAGIDDDASLAGLLAYLEAEDEFGQGLALALPTQADSVKLLTVHRAKGLEWDVVFVPGLCTKVFPSTRGRGRWPTATQELPSPLRGDAADLPAVLERSSKGLRAFAQGCKAAELLEERRLAYVALTRPRAELVASCHWWGPEQKLPRGPSVFMTDVLEAMASWGAEPEVMTPPPATDGGATPVNPANRTLDRYDWPVEASRDEVQRRLDAAQEVREAQEVGWRVAASAIEADLLLDEQGVVQQWDLEIDRLLEESRLSRSTEIVVPLPSTLSATTVQRLRDDATGLARDLARPMPRKPSAAARFGTRFHAWVESYVGQQHLVDPDEMSGRADSGIDDDSDLRELTEAFSAGPFGSRAPYQVEAPFMLVLAGQVVKGRIDAVYETGSGFQVVDWKTNQDQTADPLQLAIYRLAWAELMGVSLAEVEAAFYYVRTGELVTPPDLPGRAELERLLSEAATTRASE
ncbi:MAG: UvrD-helicase domain-containing protein [Nocardioidaceae bacterium]